MAKASDQLIRALRETIDRLSQSDRYAWGHMGSCNCGFLAQTVTQLSPGEIHQIALEKAGMDWAEHAIDYCPDSGFTVDHILSKMLELGLTTDDIAALEHLTDPHILARLPPPKQHLQRNQREDVLLYMETWVALLKEELAQQPKPASVHELRTKTAPPPQSYLWPKAANQ